MLRALAVALAFLVALSACDTTDPVLPPNSPPDTPPDTRVAVDRTRNLDVNVALSLSFGRAGIGSAQGAFGSLPYAQSRDGALSVGESNLLLSGVQDGEARVLGRSPTTHCEEVEGTPFPFMLDAAVDYRVGEWPVAFGAPVEADGTPRVYGDYMAWEVYCPAPTDAAPTTLRDLRIEAALFKHRALDRVRFLRFEITNTGATPVTDFRAGFYADLDVGGAALANNFVGVAGPATYAYMRQDYDGQDGHPSSLGAMQILESPDGRTTVQRVIYGDAGPGDPPILGEGGFEAPVLQNALRGLANDASPIRNPITDEVTTRMYTGDPVAETGWLDGGLTYGETGWDIRALNASGPTTLAPGQASVLTAALVAGQGTDLESSLDYARTTLADVAARPDLWSFPTDDDAPARR